MCGCSDLAILKCPCVACSNYGYNARATNQSGSNCFRYRSTPLHLWLCIRDYNVLIISLCPLGVCVLISTDISLCGLSLSLLASMLAAGLHLALHLATAAWPISSPFYSNVQQVQRSSFVTSQEPRGSAPERTKGMHIDMHSIECWSATDTGAGICVCVKCWAHCIVWSG